MRSSILLALLVTACSTTPSPSVSTSTPSAVVDSLPTPSADAGPYTVEHHEQLGSGPTSGPAQLSAMSMHGDLTLTLSNFSHYCAPMPTFTVEQHEHVLTLTVVQPDAVSRCIAGHNMELSLDGIDMRDPLINDVVIVNAEGQELVSTSVARAR